MFSNELDFEQSEKLVELIYKMAQIDSQYDFDEESFVEKLKFASHQRVRKLKRLYCFM